MKLLSLILSFLVIASFAPAAAVTKPNVLWLIAEDMGLALGCYGQQEVHTPNLDQLAQQGMRYTRAYTTAPVCSPSRSALMTGMYAVSIGAQEHRTQNKQPLPDGVQLITHRMQAGGYFTANLVALPAPFGFKGTGKTDWNFKFEGAAFNGKAWAELTDHQPFFAQLNFQETHRDFHAPAQADPAKISLPPYYPDHPTVRTDYGKYLDAATELDRKVGLIVAQLKEEHLWETTMIVFMGDNGEAHVRGKQFCYEEGLHVPLLIVWPQAFPPPAHYEAGSVSERFIEGIDLPATILSVTGQEVPKAMQGRAFLGAQATAPRTHVFGARDRCDETVMRLRTVRDARYRYIRNLTPEVPFFAPNAYKSKQYPAWDLIQELQREGKLTPIPAALCAPSQAPEEVYDLVADPHEIKNLATSSVPEDRAALTRLRALLDDWMKECDHSQPTTR